MKKKTETIRKREYPEPAAPETKSEVPIIEPKPGDDTVPCGYVAEEEYSLPCAHYFAKHLLVTHLVADHRLSIQDAVSFVGDQIGGE